MLRCQLICSKRPFKLRMAKPATSLNRVRMIDLPRLRMKHRAQLLIAKDSLMKMIMAFVIVMSRDSAILLTAMVKA